jgi:hypothetical protein
MVQSLINSGIIETAILTAMLLLLVINELLSGVEIEPIMKMRRYVQISMIPLGILFTALVIVRIGHLI